MTEYRVRVSVSGVAGRGSGKARGGGRRGSWIGESGELARFISGAKGGKGGMEDGLVLLLVVKDMIAS